VAVARDLRATLPGDVLVFTREEFIRGEQEYLVQVKPLGIVFRMGALVGCVAAAVMLFQVLATDVTFRLREYAMLTAMGFRARFVYGVGLCQAALYLGASAMAAAGLAAGIFLTVRKITTLPAWLDWPLAEATLGLVAALGALSTLLALQRLRRAAPAELFSA
jgi:putative ABC transport system permease protein